MPRYEFKRVRLGASAMGEPTGAEYETRLSRLVAAGFSPEAADMVAQHPRGGPVVLAPGIVVSVFALREPVAEAAAS